MKCAKCKRSSHDRRQYDVRAAAGGSYESLLCAACYADEFGERNALEHFTAREIAGERRRRAAAAARRAAQ